MRALKSWEGGLALVFVLTLAWNAAFAPDGNPLEIVKGVKALLPTIERVAPPGVEVVNQFDSAHFVNASIDEVTSTLVEAILIVVIVIFLFLGTLRAVLIPVLTILGMQFSFLLAGAIIIENVFYLPGLGRLIFQSISNRDLIVVRNCVMFLATMVVVVNFCVDVLYAVIDPRVKASDI